MNSHRKRKLRIGLVALVFCLIFGMIGLRFFIICIQQQEQFSSIAQKQYAVTTKINPARGQLFDRHNKQLAINKESTSAFIMPIQMRNQQQTERFLKAEFPSFYRQLKADENKKFLWVERNISDATHKKIVNDKGHDIHLLPELSRYYPSDALAPIIGRTNIDNSGIAGLEYSYNRILQGTPKVVELQKDARGKKRYFAHQILEEGKPGQDLHLCLDTTLQFFTHEEVARCVERFKAASGSAIIMNPDNGEILAMVSYPCDDPNGPVKNMSLLKHNAVSECYEFGSVIKIFSALAALEEEVVTPDEVIECEGDSHYFDNFKVTNWKELHTLPFHEVIRFSSNVGIAKVVSRLGPKLYDHLKKLGFSTKTGCELPGEVAGILAPPKRWSKSSAYVLSFGYEMASSLIQLAKALCIIANDGYDIQPTLLLGKDQSEPQKLYSDGTITALKDILEKSAYRHQVDGYRTMGKTGTARLAEKGTYSLSKHIYTFGGIIEKDGYRRVIATFIKEPRNPHLWASQVSGPLFQKIAQKMTLHEQAQALA